jgi:hypothetical protein
MSMQKILEGTFHGGSIIVEQAPPGIKPSDLHFPLAPYIAGIDLGANPWDKTWLQLLLRQMIQGGAVYLAFHGYACEVAHDMADTIRDESPQNDDTIILTTWHPEQTPTTFVEDLYLAIPARSYAMKTTGVYVLTIGVQKDAPTVEAFRKVFNM